MGLQPQADTRRVHVGGSTPNSDGAFLRQVAREWTNHFEGCLVGRRFFVHGRDTRWTGESLAMLEDEGIESVRCPARAPSCNAYAERFVRSVKGECLDRMVFFGEESLRRALTSFVQHDHLERDHQGVGNELLESRERLQPRAVGRSCIESGSEGC